MKFKTEKKITVFEALCAFQPESSRNTIRSWIKDGRVTVNGKAVQQANVEIEPGVVVEISERKVKWQNDLKIVYEDADLVVVDKPESLLSVETNFQKTHTVHAYLKDRYRPNKVFVIHRLDQETSGLILFARTELAYRILKEELASHKVSRIYFALLEGKLQGKGKWENYLYEDPNYHVHVTQDSKKGEKAITYYEAVRFSKGCTLTRFELKTGKKNQIRVQAQAALHPVLGDTKYGGSMRSDRLYLHAYQLSFTHPRTKKRLTFTSPLPKKMDICL